MSLSQVERCMKGKRLQLLSKGWDSTPDRNSSHSYRAISTCWLTTVATSMPMVSFQSSSAHHSTAIQAASSLAGLAMESSCTEASSVTLSSSGSRRHRPACTSKDMSCLNASCSITPAIRTLQTNCCKNSSALRPNRLRTGSSTNCLTTATSTVAGGNYQTRFSSI